MKVRANISFRINEGKFRRGTFLRFLGRQRTYSSKSSVVFENNGLQPPLNPLLAKEGTNGWFPGQAPTTATSAHSAIARLRDCRAFQRESKTARFQKRILHYMLQACRREKF